MGQQWCKNTVGTKIGEAKRQSWTILGLNTLILIYQDKQREGFLHDFFFFSWEGWFWRMTQRQNHRCQPSQRHLHLEFNLDVFYLHHTQRRVDDPQKAPVDLLKTTLWTRCAAHDPEAVRSEQCGSSLLRTCATSLRSHTSLRCAGAFSSGEIFFFPFSPSHLDLIEFQLLHFGRKE